MRLKTETRNFLWVAFWSTFGQQVLPKFGKEKMSEKTKNVIFDNFRHLGQIHIFGIGHMYALKL